MEKGRIITSDHLVIPDSHAQPDVSNERFDWLGEYIVEHQPQIIIDIGDSADMASLCSYDKGNVRAEGRRYKDDIQAYHDAMDRLKKPLNKYNNTQTRHHKKKYKPRFVKCRGNHEQRIQRAATESPSLYGYLSFDDLKEAEYGFEVYDFLKPALIDGIAYQHYFTSGVMGRPISGVNHARTLINKKSMSCVCGHSHMRDFAEDIDAVGRRMFGLAVGCYFEHDESYTTENDRFWRGLVHLKEVYRGEAEPSFISIDRMREIYS